MSMYENVGLTSLDYIEEILHLRKALADVSDECSKAYDKIANLKQQRWISIKDRMPDRKDYEWLWSGERRLVIFVCGVIHGYRDVVLGSYSYASKQWTDLYGEKIDDVTHWMPFPKMPESEDDAE